MSGFTHTLRAATMLGREALRNLLRPSQRSAASQLAKRRTELYHRFVPGNGLVFDVGANMGNRVEAFLRAGARVVAIEPQEQCCAYLKLKFGRRVSVVNAAAGSKSGKGTLKVNRDSHTIASMSENWMQAVGNTRFRNYRWGRQQEVQVVTLDEAIAIYGIPAFIKIDVEGYEREVLTGLSTPVPALSFEYTTPEATDEALACLDLVNILSRQYRYNVIHAENVEFALRQWISYDEMRHILENHIDVLQGFGDIYACKNPPE